MIHLRKKIQTATHKKDGRINPHRSWVAYMTVFMIVLTAEIIFSTYVFIHYSRALDAPSIYRINTNVSQINKIEASIKKAEEAVEKRAGGIEL